MIRDTLLGLGAARVRYCVRVRACVRACACVCSASAYERMHVRVCVARAFVCACVCTWCSSVRACPVVAVTQPSLGPLTRIHQRSKTSTQQNINTAKHQSSSTQQNIRVVCARLYLHLVERVGEAADNVRLVRDDHGAPGRARQAELLRKLRRGGDEVRSRCIGKGGRASPQRP